MLNGIKNHNVFFLAVVFFASAFVLCPITYTCAAKAGVSVGKKISEDQKKTETVKSDGTSNENISIKQDEALYEYEKPIAEEESYTWMIFKTMIVLGLLVAGFYYFYRFITKKTGFQSVGREVIKILSVVPVGQNKFLQVIDIAGKVMVLGVTDSNISLIAEIQDKDEIDRIRLLSSKSSPIQPGGFHDYISKYISRLLKKETRDNVNVNYEFSNAREFVDVDKMEYLKKQRERLKNINGKDNEK